KVSGQAPPERSGQKAECYLSAESWPRVVAITVDRRAIRKLDAPSGNRHASVWEDHYWRVSGQARAGKSAG
ncbi:MAG TPA: hypothetical protein VIU43_03400, partial [Nitrosospira sp.]